MARSSTDRVVVDFAAHFLPGKSPTGSFKLIEENHGPIFSDFDAAHERFVEAGLDGAVISWSSFIGDGDAEATAEANDTILDITDDWDQYYALAAIPMAAGGEVAAEEFERCLDAGFNGGAVATENEGVMAHDADLRPIYEVASEAGAPVLIHPKIDDSLGAGVLDDNYLLNGTFGREIALCRAICHFIHDGFLDDYPGWTPVVHHTGGNVANMLGRIRGKLNYDEAPDHLKSGDEFEEILQDRVYVDTSGYFGEPIAYRSAVEVLSADNVLLGSDFPYETRSVADWENVISGIEEATTTEQADKILGQNTLDLLINT